MALSRGASADRSEAAVVSANTAAGRPADAEIKETPLEALASICSVLVVGLFIMGFIFQNFVIPSGSMEKTLLIGDHVLVDRITLRAADLVGAVCALSSGEARRHYRLPEAES